MTNITSYLKSVNITKSDLALELNISRPTLNQYIEIFEKGGKIGNERYDIIFNRLFGEELNKKQFEKRISSVKLLLERDRRYDIGNLDPKAADMVARIHNCMIDDMSDKQWNYKIYDTILILLLNYKKNPIMRELAGYFSDLNSTTQLTNLTQETKAYYAYYYKCFKAILEGPPPLNEEDYRLFEKRKREIANSRLEQMNDRNAKIKSKIQGVLKDIENENNVNGVDVSEDELLRELVRRLQNQKGN